MCNVVSTRDYISHDATATSSSWPPSWRPRCPYLVALRRKIRGIITSRVLLLLVVLLVVVVVVWMSKNDPCSLQVICVAELLFCSAIAMNFLDRILNVPYYSVLTCMESALIISPCIRWPISIANLDFPVPVEPKMTTTGGTAVLKTQRTPDAAMTALESGPAAGWQQLCTCAVTRVWPGGKRVR